MTVFDRNLQAVATFSTEDGSLADDMVTTLAVDGDTGQVWVGTDGGGVTVFDRDLQVVATSNTRDWTLMSYNVQALAVEAALTRKREAIYHAAMLDPHTGAELDLDQIWSMVDELIKAHGDWLPTYH